MRLPRIQADTTALRESPELRSLVLGNFVSSMGTQASLVALPYQLYVQTKPDALVIPGHDMAEWRKLQPAY